MLQYTIISGLMASFILSHLPRISTDLDRTFDAVSSTVELERRHVKVK